MLAIETYPKSIPLTTPLALLCDEDGAVLYPHPFLNEATQRVREVSGGCGKVGQTFVLLQQTQHGPTSIVIVGIGKSDEIDLDRIRTALGDVVQTCMRHRMSRVVVAMPEFRTSALSPLEVVEAAMEGACLGNYRFTRYKEAENPLLEEVRFWVTEPLTQQQPRLAFEVETRCQGTWLARDWVNTPSNDKKPAVLADCFVQEARSAGIETTVLDETTLRQLEFNALLAVSAGSSEPPRLVLLEYGSAFGEPVTALIGKGITFDSGGLNLKSGDSMRDMKIDMAGAAAVVSTMIAAARLELPLHLVCAVPLVENMPSGTSTRPGDIVRSLSGKTVEINNTDAEGRLILADTLSYVQSTYHPKTCIDIATLTGACMVGLGERIAGLFSSDEELLKQLADSGRRTGERCWPMPLPKDYKEFLKTETADISNTSSSKWGGAVTAALFLSEFVQKDTFWAHIDIAGPAHAQKATSICPKGGTGFGVRLLLDYLQRLVG